MNHSQSAYDVLFTELADTLRSGPGEWETRQFDPPAAYMHVSQAGWEDGNLNGIHLEAYIEAPQLRAREALVALHCEGGWPLNFRELFMSLITQRAREAIEGWNRKDSAAVGELGRWEVKGPAGMSVCEVRVPFGSNPVETVGRVTMQLRRLQTLAGVIDEMVAHCKRKLNPETAASPVGEGHWN